MPIRGLASHCPPSSVVVEDGEHERSIECTWHAAFSRSCMFRTPKDMVACVNGSACKSSEGGSVNEPKYSVTLSPGDQVDDVGKGGGVGREDSFEGQRFSIPWDGSRPAAEVMG